MKQTLCWDCRKATGACCWSESSGRSHVPGWTAVETKVRMNNDTYAPSYIVVDCPEFERDGIGGGVKRARSD